MGLMAGLLGTASKLDPEKLTTELNYLLLPDEKIHVAFKVIRDMFIFTNLRLVLIDKQGLTGKKVEYHIIPYQSISHFSVETAGQFDMDSEIKLWVRGKSTPIKREFKKGVDVIGIQKTITHFITH